MMFHKKHAMFLVKHRGWQLRQSRVMQLVQTSNAKSTGKTLFLRADSEPPGVIEDGVIAVTSPPLPAVSTPTSHWRVLFMPDKTSSRHWSDAPFETKAQTPKRESMNASAGIARGSGMHVPWGRYMKRRIQRMKHSSQHCGLTPLLDNREYQIQRHGTYVEILRMTNAHPGPREKMRPDPKTRDSGASSRVAQAGQ